MTQSGARELSRLGPQQPRGPGGKFGPRAAADVPAAPEVPRQPEAAPEPAEVILARVRELRTRHNGLLIRKPDGIDGAAYHRPSSGDAPLPNKACAVARKWLEAIAAIPGACPGDVEIAWIAWQPHVAGDPAPKMRLMQERDRLKAVACKGYVALLKRAEAEARPAKERARREAALRKAEADQLKAAEALGKQEAAVARAAAALEGSP